MNIDQTINELKNRPDFSENVGMLLVHNGTVRNWSRQDKNRVAALEVEVNQDKIEQLRKEYKSKEGIYEIIIEPKSGRFRPGDDLLFMIVAGDLRENVLSVMTDLLNRVKAEAVKKKEIYHS